MASIFYVDYHIPDTLIPVEDVFKNCTDSILPGQYDSFDDLYETLRKVDGLDRITIENKEPAIRTFSDLMSNFLRNKNVDPMDVSYIFFNHSRYFVTDDGVSIPYYLRQEYGLGNASIFSLQIGCAGSTIASVLATGMLSLNDKGKYAIILSNSYFPEMEDRYIGYTIMGDGAGIMVISRESADYDIIGFDSITDGLASYEQYYGIGNAKEIDIPYVGMKFAKNFLSNNGLRPSDIYMMIPQNISTTLLRNMYLNYMSFPVDKCFLQNIPNGGHMGDVDVIRNLKDFTDMYSPPIGALVLLFAIGIIGGRKSATSKHDAIWQAVLLRCNRG